MVSYYPMFLKMSGKKCIVVGGGAVAQRKVQMLLEFGADVLVISPELCTGLKELADTQKIGAQNRPYQTGDLQGAFVVVAATDDSTLNHAVAGEARKSGVLVNVVDDAEVSDFIAPSYLRRGDVTIAVSTGGRSPALARKIRTKLEMEFGEEFAALATLIDEVRHEVKREGMGLNGDDWQEALDLGLLVALLRQGNREKARAILLEALQQRGKVS